MKNHGITLSQEKHDLEQLFHKLKEKAGPALKFWGPVALSMLKKFGGLKKYFWGLMSM